MIFKNNIGQFYIKAATHVEFCKQKEVFTKNICREVSKNPFEPFRGQNCHDLVERNL